MNRVVITGMGIVSPLGHKLPLFWNLLKLGTSSISALTKLDNSMFYQNNLLAAEIKDLQLFIYDNFQSDAIRYSVIAIDAAIEDANLRSIIDKSNNIGVIVGTTHGNYSLIESFNQKLNIESIELNRDEKKKYKNIKPSTIPFYISKKFNLGGSSHIIGNVCSSGNSSLSEAYIRIKNGLTPIMIAGGVDSLSRISYTSLYNLQALTKKKCRPFDEDRDGTVVGEGAGFLILEELNHALKRKVKIYCEMRGFGYSCDAFHATRPDPHGLGLKIAIKNALDSSRLTHDEISYINAHGTGTKANDIQEISALKYIFGERLSQIPVISLKSMLGHSLGASSAIEAIACILSIYEQIIPPTINTENIDKSFNLRLDTVQNVSRKAKVNYVLNNSIGFGGNICCTIFGRYE